MKQIIKGRKREDYVTNLVRYMGMVLEDAGIEYRSIGFVSDTHYPIPPKRYAVQVLLADGQRGLCVWEDPEGWVDLLDSIEDWLQKVIKEQLVG